MKRTCIAVALALGLWLPGAAHALETVRITNIGHGYWAGPLFVAQRLNLFEKHGLKAEVTTVKGGSLSLQTALTKQADVAQVTFEHVLKAASQGKRVVSIYRFAKVPNNSLLANNKIANGVKGASVADRVRALKGARVGVPSAGGSGEKMLQVLANKYGLTLPGDVQTVYLGADPGAYVAAFKRDQIDAAMMFEPTGTFLKQANLGTTLVDLIRGEEPMFSDVLFLTLTTHPDTIKEKPETLRKLTAVYDEALNILHNDKARGKALMAKEFPGLTPETNESTYDAMEATWAKDGRMDVGQAKRTMAYMSSLGGLNLPDDFDPSPYFSNDLMAK